MYRARVVMEWRSWRSFEPHAASAASADGTLPDQLDSILRQAVDELHERVDLAANHPLRSFHTLDRRHGEAAPVSELPLVEPQQGSGRPELRPSNHRTIPEE